MAISIVDAGWGNVQSLAEPLLFRLPGLPGVNTDGAQCVYLDVGGGNESVRWSTQGVWRAKDAEVAAAGFNPAGIWCFTNHLSIFAALLQAVLGCTNLELLTPEAIGAIVEHKFWWRARPVVLFLSVSCTLFAVTLVGCVREVWELRLGRSYQPTKDIHLCKSFVKWGPQVLKHKYTVFVVFAKDLLSCMYNGEKLRVPILKAAVQKCFAVQSGVSLPCVAQHCWNGGAWLQTPASLPHTVLCRKLEFHAGGADKVVQWLSGRRPHHFLCRFLVTFLAGHPLLDSLRLGASSLSVLKRTVLQLAAFMGVLATNAMIFNFSGAERGWEADATCPIEPTSQLFIIVATAVSIMLNVLPNAFLMEIAKQVHGRPSWNAVFWALTWFYFSFSTFFVIIALANLNPKDQAKWHKSMEWSLAFKFLGMPSAQALRNCLMLEHFLRTTEERSQCLEGKGKDLPQILGLRDSREEALPNMETEAVDAMARRAVSAEELVNFMALLGDKLMPDYKPESTTSDEVMHGAVRLFCREQPAFAETGLQVEVVEVHGLRMPGRPIKTFHHMSCAVFHLGGQERLLRPIQSEERSSAALASAEGRGCRCRWQFCTALPGLEFQDAVGFAVTELGRVVGTALLPVADVLKSRGCFQGELLLHPPSEETTSESFQVPSAVPAMASKDFSGSKGAESSRVGLSQHSRLLVKVEAPHEYLQALAQRELAKLKDAQAAHQSEAHRDSCGLHNELLKLAHERVPEQPKRAWHFAPTRSAYSEPFSHDSSLPPERLVVHCLQGTFLNLVVSLLADALDEKGAYGAVEGLLLERDHHGLLDWLRQRGLHRRRFWIDMFAMELDHSHAWRKDLLAAMPTLIRGLRRECCHRMVCDLRAKKPMSCGLPTQLLVLDQDLLLFQEDGCLAEVILAKAMNVQQRLLLHPAHLRGPQLGERLMKLQQLPPGSRNDMPWTGPYINDGAEVMRVLRELAVKAVKEKTGDDEATMQDLRLSDTAAVLAGFAAAESVRSVGDRRLEDQGAQDAGAVDDAADADAGDGD